MPDTRGIAGFGAGFQQTSNARSNRMQVEELNRTNKVAEAQKFRERIDATVENSLKKLQEAAKSNAASAFSSPDGAGKQQAVEVQTRTAQELWKSTKQVLEKSQLYAPSEIANIEQQFRIAATLSNPAAEKKLIAAGEAEGKLPSQQTLESQKQDVVQKQFLNEQDEIVTQLKNGDFVDGQGKAITDSTRLNNLRNIPTTQNINTTTNTPKTVSALQAKLLQTKERKHRLLNIRASFRPELLETWTKLRAKFVAGAEKHLGIEPSEKDKQLITDITNFRGETALGINQTIHDMTGAQMSQFEAKRLRMPEPDVGEKLLEGQSPTEFKANVDRAIREMELADLRFTKLLKEGVLTEADVEAGVAGDKAMALIPLSKMEELYEQRGSQILEEVKLLNPKLTDDEAFNMANQKLKAEFTL